MLLAVRLHAFLHALLFWLQLGLSNTVIELLFAALVEGLERMTLHVGLHDAARVLLSHRFAADWSSTECDMRT